MRSTAIKPVARTTYASPVKLLSPIPPAAAETPPDPDPGTDVQSPYSFFDFNNFLRGF